MRKNNKGYSLVELIIVIVIMGLLSGTALFSISMIFGASAKACANDLKEALAENKVIAMGKSEARLKIYRDDDECVYVMQEQLVKDGDAWKWNPSKVDGNGNAVVEQIGNSRVYVSYVEEGKTEAELKKGEELYLCYDRSNGSFSDQSKKVHDDKSILCETIYVKGGHRSYKLTLIQLTGKVEVELE